MKFCGVAGSTPCRRVRRVYECMRARRRRATHSVSTASGAVLALEHEAGLLEHREPGLDARSSAGW